MREGLIHVCHDVVDIAETPKGGTFHAWFPGEWSYCSNKNDSSVMLAGSGAIQVRRRALSSVPNPGFLICMNPRRSPSDVLCYYKSEKRL